jgi:hypothetical protein
MNLFIFAFRDCLFENNDKETCNEYFRMDHRRTVMGSKITTFTCILHFIVENINMLSNLKLRLTNLKFVAQFDFLSRKVRDIQYKETIRKLFYMGLQELQEHS